MKKIAIEKARNRLDKAKEALERVRSSQRFPDFQSAWTDFLVALNSIVFILEKGARGDPKSRQWYGGKKAFGRNDPLLRYLHQARNADEHGLEPVTERKPGLTWIGGPGESVHVESLIRTGKLISAEFLPVDGKLPSAGVVPPHAALIPVADDRFGQIFDPPTEHLSLPLLDTSPAAVAEAGLNYYCNLIKEAEEMIS